MKSFEAVYIDKKKYNDWLSGVEGLCWGFKHIFFEAENKEKAEEYAKALTPKNKCIFCLSELEE